MGPLGHVISISVNQQEQKGDGFMVSKKLGDQAQGFSIFP